MTMLREAADEDAVLSKQGPGPFFRSGPSWHELCPPAAASCRCARSALGDDCSSADMPPHNQPTSQRPSTRSPGVGPQGPYLEATSRRRRSSSACAAFLLSAAKRPNQQVSPTQSGAPWLYGGLSASRCAAFPLGLIT